MNRRCCTALLVLAVVPAIWAFQPPSTHAAKTPARAEDLPYIKCGVCQAFVKQAMNAVKTLRSEEKPGQKVTEGDIIDTLEKMCNPDLSEGDWISHIDLKEEGDVLKLVDMGQPSACEVECRTIARACDKIHEEMDLSDLSELLYKNAGRSALVQVACVDQTGVCAKKPPPLPQGRTPGPEFVPMDDDAVQRTKMLRNMKAAGLKGTMYDRDSISDMTSKIMAGKGVDGDEDDDEDASAGGAGGMPDLGNMDFGGMDKTEL